MKIGIVGFPYSGKTTFFHSVSFDSLELKEATKRKSNLAVIKISDNRLDLLTEIFKPKKKVNATISIEDFMGSANPEIQGFNTKFSIEAKTYDAFILIARAFNIPSIPNYRDKSNPSVDIRQFLEDTLIFDLSFIEIRLERLEKDLKKLKNRDHLITQKNFLLHWYQTLQNGIHLREIDFSTEEELIQKNFQFLTRKPLLIGVNFSENEIEDSASIIENLRHDFADRKITIEPFFAKIEAELLELEPTEREEFMNDLGIKETATQRLIRSAYNILGLQSFFTVGEDECRAWTIRKGMNAQESAGVIHSDFYNKFIRAEVVSFDDFIKYRTFQKCKENGVFRLEGKEYIVKDGDIMHIRHN